MNLPHLFSPTTLGALELAFLTTDEETDPAGGRPFRFISLAVAQESVQKPMLKLDEDMYYDMLSAFIKSMRGSDPDAALLWFSRMLYAGVDPKLIVRRIVVHASEDVGLADPTAMLQAQAAVTAHRRRAAAASSGVMWPNRSWASYKVLQRPVVIIPAPASQQWVSMLWARMPSRVTWVFTTP